MCSDFTVRSTGEQLVHDEELSHVHQAGWGASRASGERRGHHGWVQGRRSDSYEVCSDVLTILFYQNENITNAGREPVTFENPLYSTATGRTGAAAVIHATQVKQDWNILYHMYVPL